MSNHISKLVESIHGTPSLAQRYHHSTQQSLTLPPSEQDFPDSWRRIHFKVYPRLPKVPLQCRTSFQSSLREAMLTRRSARQFVGPLDFEDVSDLLAVSGGIVTPVTDYDESRRAYPSAGARYPLEIYVAVLEARGINSGLYHYNVKHNQLEVLTRTSVTDDIKEAFGDEPLAEASVLFIVSAVFARNLIKYGDRGYRYILIEAGHLAQNICLIATELGLGACTLGGFDDRKVSDLLDISAEREVPIYAIALGRAPT